MYTAPKAELIKLAMAVSTSGEPEMVLIDPCD